MLGWAAHLVSANGKEMELQTDFTVPANQIESFVTDVTQMALSLAALLACLQLVHALPPGTKIFGVGMAATGDTELAAALDVLGYNVTQHDHSLTAFLHPDRPVNLSGKYDAVDAVISEPSSMYTAELLAAYPHAKFILTIRSNETAWLHAFKYHSLRLNHTYGGVLPFRVKAMQERFYGSVSFDPATLSARYRDHNEHVVSIVPPAQLLVIDVKAVDAWASLCAFLGRSDGLCANGSTTSFPRNRLPAIRAKLAARQNIISVNPASASSPAYRATRFAYVALLVDPSNSTQREYFLSLLVAIESIRMTGTTNDIIVMILGDIDDEHSAILTQASARVVLIRPVGEPLPVNFEPVDVSLVLMYFTLRWLRPLTAL